jgi:hypothetical protein
VLYVKFKSDDGIEKRNGPYRSVNVTPASVWGDGCRIATAMVVVSGAGAASTWKVGPFDATFNSFEVVDTR